jgi:hypothetical protein
VRSKPQESGVTIDNTNDVSTECGVSSITNFLSLSIEDSPECTETFPCSCVLTELWNRDWRMEARVHVLTEESMELEVYLFGQQCLTC